MQNLVHKLAQKHGNERTSLLPILQDIVRNEKYLSEDAMLCVARELDISAADVYGTATFYTFLDTIPRGQHIVRICKTISCHMQGKEKVIEAIQNALNIKVGETSHDHKFTLLTTNCLGHCHQGPVMLVDDEVYAQLSPDKAVEVLEKYARNSK
jgi:NADH-quinone oxidoreductase subunit E